MKTLPPQQTPTGIRCPITDREWLTPRTHDRTVAMREYEQWVIPLQQMVVNAFPSWEWSAADYRALWRELNGMEAEPNQSPKCNVALREWRKQLEQQ